MLDSTIVLNCAGVHNWFTTLYCNACSLVSYDFFYLQNMVLYRRACSIDGND